MIVRQTITALAIALLAAPALAGPVASPVPVVRDHIVAVQDKGEKKAEKKGEEQGKKQAKGKAKHEDDKKDARSNKGGATRGGERSDQVQGMQDTGKGPGKRP